MPTRTPHWVALAIIALTLIASLVLYPRMPDPIASHWNASGEVDGYTTKLTGLFVMPAALVLLYFVFMAIPAIDPLKANIAKFRKYYDWFVVLIFAMLAYLHALTLLWNLGVTADMLRAMAPAFAVMLFFAGVLMEHAEPNWFIGIRTPWTLSSPTVWARTHERGALAFKIAGGIALLGVLLPSFWALLFVLVPVTAAGVYATVYSYVAYQQETRG